MNVKAIFSQMGMILGDIISENETQYEIENPVLLVTQREGAALVPFLALMEEKTVYFKKSSLAFNQTFTPVIDVINNYNQMYGSGIVQVAGKIKI